MCKLTITYSIPHTSPAQDCSCDFYSTGRLMVSRKPHAYKSTHTYYSRLPMLPVNAHPSGLHYFHSTFHGQGRSSRHVSLRFIMHSRGYLQYQNASAHRINACIFASRSSFFKPFGCFKSSNLQTCSPSNHPQHPYRRYAPAYPCCCPGPCHDVCPCPCPIPNPCLGGAVPTLGGGVARSILETGACGPPYPDP